MHPYLPPLLPSPPSRLAKGVVDVWRADVSAAEELVELLSPAERARAARMVRERDRMLWTRARGVLRALLGVYCKSDPRALCFQIGAHGKPLLSPVGLGSIEAAMSFNVSHSGALAVYAFTKSAPVGVDVEVASARTRGHEVALAERAFGPARARRLRALDAPARRAAFLREWVRHEAALKCRGTGLAGKGTAEAAAPELWVADLEVGSSAVAAVAVQAGPQELRFWDFPAAGQPRRSLQPPRDPRPPLEGGS